MISIWQQRPAWAAELIDARAGSQRVDDTGGASQPFLFEAVGAEARARDHDGLIYDSGKATGRWEPSELKPGQALREPAPLFKKLGTTPAEELAIVEFERSRLGQPQS